MAGICGDASNSRRGERVRTVTAFPFKSNAVESGIVTGKPFLNVVRSLATSLRNEDEKCYDKLLWFIRIQIHNSNNGFKDFEEICESLVSLLYFGLVYPKLNQKKNVESVFACFLEKWFGFYETFDIEQFLLNVEDRFKISSFASVLFLHYFWKEAPVNSLNYLLKWQFPNTTNTPQWIKDILSCSEEAYQNLNKILYKSLSFPNCQVEITFSRDYLNAVSHFFEAVGCYKLGEYEESISILNSIKNVNCSSYLRGWKELMIGLNLECMKRSNCALLKFKEAIHYYQGCFRALYYSSRIFKEMGLLDACLECLDLLSQVNAEENHSGNTLQTIALSIHIPVIENLTCRSNWLLASCHLQNEKWDEAKNLLHKLLMNWNNKKSNEETGGFLDPQDEVPDVPQKSFVTMSYLFALLNLKKYDEVALNNVGNVGNEAGCAKFVQLPNAAKIDYLSKLSCHLMIAEALYQQEKFESSLEKSGSILIYLESLNDPSGKWQPLILLTKIYLYKMLSLLYMKNPFNMRKNALHFTRLQDQCMHLFNEEKKKLEKESEIIDIALFILEKRLHNFEMEITF